MLIKNERGCLCIVGNRIFIFFWCFLISMMIFGWNILNEFENILILWWFIWESEFEVEFYKIIRLEWFMGEMKVGLEC